MARPLLDDTEGKIHHFLIGFALTDVREISCVRANRVCRVQGYHYHPFPMRAEHERVIPISQDNAPDASLTRPVHRLAQYPEGLVADFAIGGDVVWGVEIDDIHLTQIDEPREVYGPSVPSLK